MTDPIADMLSRIRNAKAVSKKTVSIPFSNLKYRLANILLEEKFVAKVEKKGRNTSRTIEIDLKYEKEGESVITGLKRISKPGQRIYSGSDKIKGVRGGYGISVVSTPKGLMTGKEAKKKNLGGEIICEIW
ncbi:MAG: 30S ribosomal protein S8 [Candidatus Pacebacteria bacterium]|jgi:small subunit ribosomal protein S8|nr:30S ribosomal protein S8 [Candidatus Paceibacterota bacterium]MDD3072140.1 30S ribosomal protein S8 [Candidatus Paceibacterota bacterium]MDD3728795.1 30S ribosomal protein S8 [Candidatus Paceibacterota bacterium]MDD4201346.1 30S ribosomal protein S8 [Candidatus Paceibacterota bacterium]MDD4466903.1 30S ribosomal protein S8 [Candidatus Paceibacterota bacterium]